MYTLIQIQLYNLPALSNDQIEERIRYCLNREFDLQNFPSDVDVETIYSEGNGC